MRHAIFYAALARLGYKKVEYGYRYISENYTHWITIFDDKDKISLQMYAYSNHDLEDDKTKDYDTGNITIPTTQVFDLIQMFKENFV